MRATTWVLVTAPLFLAGLGLVVSKGCAPAVPPTADLTRTSELPLEVPTSETRITSGTITPDEPMTQTPAAAPAPAVTPTAEAPAATDNTSARASDNAPTSPPIIAPTTNVNVNVNVNGSDAAVTTTSAVSEVPDGGAAPIADAAPPMDSGVTPSATSDAAAPAPAPAGDWPVVITSGAYPFGDASR